MKTARKVKITPITHLSEDVVKEKILEMEDIRQEMVAVKKRYDAIGKELMAHLGPKGVRQYDNLKFVVIQPFGRSIKWKDEASRLAKLLYPTRDKFRKYLSGVARRYPKKLGTAYPRLFPLKDGSESEE
jgi:predicted metal-dependent hydrolase